MARHDRRKEIEAIEKERKLQNKEAWKKHFAKANNQANNPIENPITVLNFATERQRRDAIKRKWKKISEKYYDKVVDPVAPDTESDIKKHYERIKKEVSNKHKAKIALEISEYSNKILNELPNLPKWITNNPKITGYLKNTKFLNVLNYIRMPGGIEQRFSWSKEHLHKLKLPLHKHETSTGKTFPCYYVVVRIWPKKLARQIGLSEISARKYLQILCDAGILKKLNKAGKNQPTLYSSGYWLAGEGKDKDGKAKSWNNKLYWMKETNEWIERLCELTLQPFVKKQGSL